jgi:hypothetical protein
MHISKFLNSFINSLPLVAKTGLYNDLSGKPTLGTASALDVGTTANKIIQLNASGQIPNLDGSLLQNVISSGASPSVPYSINSAKTDSNGYASFITKISNTEISFDTNSGSIPIVATYSDGSVETSNTLPNITGISTDGTYYIVKEKGGNPYNTILMPVESYTAPSSPATNQLWLDLSVVPYIPKKWNGTAWVVAQFVKLGEFVRTSGVIGTPISYTLNRKIHIKQSFSSSKMTISHNLGISSNLIDVSNISAYCKTATTNYTIGKTYPVIFYSDTDGWYDEFRIPYNVSRNSIIISLGEFLISSIGDNGNSSTSIPLANFDLVFTCRSVF